ncbi:MAG TPA: EfeM/EfeO family lipoprotein [Xanthobacteraceae bacterium]|nr:EfeM/EfeO family lipoprotein [Xanthobacteraceae bacterium]
MMTILAPSAGADPLDDAVERYRPYMIDDIDHALAGAHELRDRIVANDIAGAQKAWINARTGWERSEVFTSGFVPQLDDAIDAWPDATKGFHAIEAKLFGARSSDVRSADMQAETDALVLHLADLDRQIREMKLTAQGLLNGVARLAYEVGDSKVDGGESRFSGTSLDDMRNNVDGIELAYRILFASALEASDAKLAERVHAQIDRLKQLLTAEDLKQVDPDALRKASEDLVVTLQIAGPKMGLNPPTLEETAK